MFQNLRGQHTTFPIHLHTHSDGYDVGNLQHGGIVGRVGVANPLPPRQTSVVVAIRKIVSFDRLERTPELETLETAFAGDGAALSAILKDEELCIRCGLCAERCPNHAITMERFCFGGVSE